MIEQQARVTKVEGPVAFLRIGGQSGCAACDAGKGCGAGLFGKLLKRGPVELSLENQIDARPGQAVVLGLAESVFMKLVFRLYGWPLLAGLAGAFAAHQLAGAGGASPVILDLATFAGAVFGAALVLIFWNRASRHDVNTSDIKLLDKPAAEKACGTGTAGR